MKLLIVEDHHSTRYAFCEWLRFHGYTDLCEASNLQEALYFTDKFTFDAAIIDLKIPTGHLSQPDIALDLHGLTIGKLLRQRTPHCALVFISADHTLGAAVSKVIEQVNAHHVAYLVKSSASADTLLDTLVEICQGGVLIDAAVTFSQFTIEGQHFLRKLQQMERYWVEKVYQRLSGLTPSQRRVTDLLRRGYDHKSIAIQVNISQNGVEKHLDNVYKKIFPDDHRPPYIRPQIILIHALTLEALCHASP